MNLASHWQCEKRLGESLAVTFDNQLLCDVSFNVGKTRETVRAHKVILVSRSPTFYAQFLGPLAERGTIDIQDIEEDIFRDFLRYFNMDCW